MDNTLENKNWAWQKFFQCQVISRETIMSSNYALNVINWYNSPNTWLSSCYFKRDKIKIIYKTGKLTHMMIFCVFSL